MDIKAIEKARSRLRVASKSVIELQTAANDEEFDDAWFSFLTAWKGIYTVLEQGSKQSAQSRQWFGRIKAERKATPYLQYLFLARNDEEHGLDKSVGKGWHEVAMLLPSKDAKDGEPLEFSWQPDPNRAVGSIEVIGRAEGRILIPVKDRDGTEVHPPVVYEFMKAILSPIEIAKLALTYADTVVSDASRLRGG